MNTEEETNGGLEDYLSLCRRMYERLQSEAIRSYSMWYLRSSDGYINTRS